MSELATIARPYARAAFEFAREHESVDKWLNMLMFIDGVVKNGDFQKIMKSGNHILVTTVLTKITENYLDKFGFNFVRILIENNRLEVAEDILREFIKIKNEYEKVLNVEVISAETLSAADSSKLLKYLKDKYQQTVKMSNTVNPEILGGVIIKTENDVLDMSLKHRIESLAKELNL